MALSDSRADRSTLLAVTTTLFFALRMGTAEAADSTLFSETAGFLLGNAHRCGVPTERVERVAKVIHRQLGLLVVALGVFLRKHLIAEVSSDAQTKRLVGPGWNNLMQP
jgi:hypothetical protein